MRMRETNHLRKYANEAGKKMREPRYSALVHDARAAIDRRLFQQCARCGYQRISHDPQTASYAFYLTEGMCSDFQEPK